MNDLLICAKAVEYSIVENAAGGWGVTRNEGSGCWEYNPLTNDAQAMELLKWLTDNFEIVEITLCQDNRYSIDLSQARWYSGQTLNEAIIKAVVAMEGEG